jgi:hypothetical protein
MSALHEEHDFTWCDAPESVIMSTGSGTGVLTFHRIVIRRFIYGESMIDCCDPNGDLNKGKSEVCFVNLSGGTVNKTLRNRLEQIPQSPQSQPKSLSVSLMLSGKIT